MPSHSQGRRAIRRQRPAPSPSFGSTAAALKISWPTLSNSRFRIHSVTTSGVIASFHIGAAPGFAPSTSSVTKAAARR